MIFLLCLLNTGYSQENERSPLNIRLEPQKAGSILHDSLQTSRLQYAFHPDSIDPDSFRLVLDLNAGWTMENTRTLTNSSGMVNELVIEAVKLPDSPLADSIILSEVFFLADADNGLSNWFEILNLSQQNQSIRGGFIETRSGKFYLPEVLSIPAQSCVVVRDSSGRLMNKAQDHVILADSSGAIISRFSWNADRMNFPEDSLFSLEINNAFAATDSAGNWSIIYGKGRPARLPVDYAAWLDSQPGIWAWLRYVLWGAAGVVFILILILTFRRKR